MVLSMEVGLSPGDFVLDGDPAPLSPEGGQTPPIFVPCLLRPNGWMDEAGTWHGGIGLGPGDFVLDGDSAPPYGAPFPIFGPFLLWPNGWMLQDTTWYECRPQSRGLCVR